MTLCKHEGCRKKAYYGTEKTRAFKCGEHRTEGLKNVLSKRCQHHGCDKHPSYGKEKGVATHCKKHGMEVKFVDVISNFCKVTGCDTRASFGLEGERASFCMKHQLDNMIRLHAKKCEEPGCDKNPMFGFKGERPKRCSKHKLEGMLAIYAKRCEEPGCVKRPNFGFKGEREIFCFEHKSESMINVCAKECEKSGCGRRASFGFVGNSPLFCMKHKEVNMVDIVNKICPGYSDVACPVRTLIERNKQYCLSCDPDDSRRKRFKKYEDDFFTYVQDTLDIQAREFCVNFDSNETSKKCARIDGIVMKDDIIVCIEVDEDGHQEYDCDEHRMHLVNGELLQKYPKKNIAWIRVNPTVSIDEQWSADAIKIRNGRFDEVIKKVNEILLSKNTELVYIGFHE
jgi:hypothetical protein